MNNLSKRLSLHFFFTHPADVSWPDDVGHAADGSTLEQPAKRKQVWIQQIKCLDVTRKKKKKNTLALISLKVTVLIFITSFLQDDINDGLSRHLFS